MEEILFCFFIIDYEGLFCYSVEYECILGKFINSVLKENIDLKIFKFCLLIKNNMSFVF